MAVAQVVVEVGERARDLQLRELDLWAFLEQVHFALEVGVDTAVEDAPEEVVAAVGMAVEDAGAAGVAPAVTPWLGGVR